MARTRRVKSTNEGVTHYHLMSRTNNKAFLFVKAKIKDEMVRMLRRVADFSGIELKAYVAMSNHFHVVCKVTRSSEKIDAQELIRRVGVLHGEKAAKRLTDHWEQLSAAGFTDALNEEQDRLRARMNDISEFMKTYKEEFTRYFKRQTEYCGSIWSGRFYSTLIEGGEYLRICKRYVELNPVRAGIVSQVKDYLWVWSENEAENERFVGSVPEVEARLRKRVVQIGKGKIFGSLRFVCAAVFKYGSCFNASAAAKPVEGIGYATHGNRK